VRPRKSTNPRPNDLGSDRNRAMRRLINLSGVHDSRSSRTTAARWRTTFSPHGGGSIRTVRCNRGRRISPAKPARGGFTLVELLVVISIIAMLMALLLPAVMSARGAARRLTCKNNLRNVGLAMLSDTEAKRRFPASGNFPANGPEYYHSWVVNLLPWLERADIYDRWDFDRTGDDPVNLRLSTISLPVLICPDDDTAVPGRGNLSYVVNGGFGWTAMVGGLGCAVSYHVTDLPPIQPLDLNGNGTVNPAVGGDPSDKELLNDRAGFEDNCYLVRQ